MNENRKFIMDHVPLTARAVQAAEECAELAQKLCKLARIIDGTNPAASDMSSVLSSIDEEWADVQNAMSVVCNTPKALIDDIRGFKMSRWVGRIKDKEAHGNEH